MSEWQPIETAPKDGTAIIGFFPPDLVCEVYYDDDDDDPGWWYANTGRGDYHEDRVFPTHWIPLPAPPVTP